MDVDKSIVQKDFILFGKKIFTIRTRTEINYQENVTPILPVLEINLNDRYNNN